MILLIMLIVYLQHVSHIIFGMIQQESVKSVILPVKNVNLIQQNAFPVLPQLIVRIYLYHPLTAAHV